MANRARLVPAVVLAIAVITTTSGCLGSSDKTKAGVGQRQQVTLTMPAPDGDDADVAYFAAQVSSRTGGHVRIVVDRNTYTSVDPDNEVRLVHDLRAGKVPLAYVPSRAWERDGVKSFRALQAPFLIGNYAVLRDVTNGQIGDSMLKSLGSVGLVGLGLVPKELRRPLGRRPLTTVRAFRGARIRVVTSPTGELALRSLGARPLTAFDAHQVNVALADDKLDGVETEAHAIASNDYTRVAHYLTANLPLFAKAQTIVVRSDVLSRMSASDQAAMRAAARATVAHADPAAQERAEVAQLCHQGLRLAEASPGDVAALRERGRHADAVLERDPGTRQAIAAIEALGASATESSMASCPKAGNRAATTTAHFPDGRFETRLTVADFEAGGATQDPGFPMPFRITIRHGRWHTNESPPFGGRIIVRGDQVTFAIEQPTDSAGERETLKWSFYRGKLTFKVVDVADSGSRVIYTAHPWRRIGD
jgi:TRAP-type C4-dicarboxylate transport system substrate-binding protein